MRHPRLLIAAVCALFAAAACSPALAVNDLTVTGAPTSISGLGTDSTVVTARAPVMNAGIVQQEITQAIDPAKLRVTGLGGITYPFGWTATFSTDGTNFGAAPTTTGGWSAIRAVKASGPIDSQGSYNGRQIATGAGTEVSPTSGSFVSTGGASGDGYDVFFDDQNHVFNVFHHDRWPNGRIDCHLRSGASCGPAWPFTLKGTTSTKSMAAVDTRYDHIWVPTGTPDTPASGAPTPVPANKAGFVCIDIATITSPQFCGGTFENSFIAMTTSYMTSLQFDGVTGLAVVGSRMFAWAFGEGTQANPSKLMCLDMHANGGLGAACPNSPRAVPGIHSAYIWYSSLKASQGKLYAMGYSLSPSGTGAGCIEPATLAPCAGWSTGKVFSIGNQAASIYEQPSATGEIQGVCFLNASSGQAQCYKEDGTALTVNNGLRGGIAVGSWPARNPDTAGTRVYVADYINGNALYCYDVALNSGAGGNCPGWPVSDPSRTEAYTLVVDPYNANCVWRNGNDGVIRAYNSGGTIGCNSPPPWAELQADAIVPRMACSDSGAVREWRSFQLTGPPANTYTSATLTVYTAGGRVVTSGSTTWKDVPIPASGLTVDLSTLAVADTGPDPTFRVTFAGRSTWDNVSAKVTAVGDAPELCVTYAAESVCPIAPAKVPAGPFSAPFVTAVAATGSATLSGSGQAAFGPGSADITVGAASDANCLGTISGTTTVTNAAGPAAVGVPVTLKDAAGATIATTTTDASGNYSFDRLAAGAGYRVAFGNAGGYSADSATGNSATTARAVTAGVVTDVDGVYTTVISAPTRAATVPAAGGVFDPFAAVGSSPPATPASGSTIGATQKAATRLCDSTTTPPQNGTTVPCTLTSRVTPEGTWSVNTNSGSADAGKITFTPASGFSGAAPAQAYQVTDSASNKAAGTFTPTVVGAPTATNNTSSGAYNTPQQIDVLGNDSAATGATLNASTLKLCDVAPNAQTPPNCTATSVTIVNEGTYAVVNGQVTFTPLATFTGTVQTPVRYQVADSAGQVANALITPSVTVPAAPTATPGTASVAAGIPKAFTTTTGASGLATAGGAAFDTTRTCLVDPAAPNTCATSLTTTQGTWGLDRTTGIATFTANATGLTPGQLNPVTYRVFDVTGQSVDSTLTPTLVGAPTATDNTPSGAYNTPQQIDVLGNDSAATGATLNASTLTLCDVAPNAQTPPNCAATSVTITNEGTYAVAGGQVTFTPLATFTGTAQTPVRYQVADSAGQVVDALITPSVTAPPVPTASPEQKPVARGQSVAFTTLTGAQGLATSGGPAFTISSTCLITPGTSTCAQGTTVTVQGEGTYTLDRTTGIVTFAADQNAQIGQLTPVGYRVTDALGRTADSTLTPRVVAPPQATDNATTAVWNTPLVIDALANDQVDSATALDPATVRLCAISPNPQTPPQCTATTLTIPGEGTYSVDSFTGRITFTPDPAFTGDATPVRYQVADGAGQVTDARILLSVAPVAPTATGDSATVPSGGSATLRPAITPGTWPIDPSKTCLTVGTTCTPGATTLTLPEGTYTVDPSTGLVTFTAAPGFSGTPANPPKVMFTDMGGQSVMAPLTVTVQPAPPASVPAATAPIALPDVESTGPGQPVTVRVLGNDSATGANAFDPSTLLLRDPATGRYSKNVTIPGQGTFTANADGTVTFTPAPGFTGTTKALAYKVSDARGRTTSSTVQVIVQQGEPPWADPDYAQGPAGKPLTLNPLANDDSGPSPFDPTSLRLRHPTTGKLVTRLTIPGEGTYVVDPATGKVTFTPVKGFAGKATPVKYRVRTTGNRPAESTINVHITSPGPALQIRTTTSRPVMRVGQRVTITLKIGNAGGQMAKGTVTRAAIPRGFSVVNPMGGTVRGGYIYFRTGNLKAGGQITRRFVLVASSSAVGPTMAVYGRSRGGNVGPVADPAMIRVVAPAKRAPAPVTG